MTGTGTVWFFCAWDVVMQVLINGGPDIDNVTEAACPGMRRVHSGQGRYLNAGGLQGQDRERTSSMTWPRLQDPRLQSLGTYYSKSMTSYSCFYGWLVTEALLTWTPRRWWQPPGIPSESAFDMIGMIAMCKKQLKNAG